MMNKINCNPLNTAILTAVVAFPLSVCLSESAQAASVTAMATENSNFNLISNVQENSGDLLQVQASPVIQIAQSSTNSSLMQQALALLKQKKYSEAREAFFKINPKDASVWYYLGLTSYHLNDLSRAIYAFTAALELKPTSVASLYQRGLSYYNSQNYQAALKDYNTALSIDPKYYPAYLERGIVYDQLGKYQEAIADYKRAIQGNYQKHWAFNNIGIAYSNLGNYQAAIENYNRAISLNSRYAMAYNNRGVVYQQLGNINKASADYKKALQIDPNHQYASSNLAALTQPVRYNHNWDNNDSGVKPNNSGYSSHPTDPNSPEAHWNWEECGDWSGC